MTKAGCKTRKKFIKMLRNALLWRYNSNEIQDIISDYDGFFAAGLEQGKTEAELCSEFGDPEDIAKSLDIELKAKRSFFVFVKQDDQRDSDCHGNNTYTALLQLPQTLPPQQDIYRISSCCFIRDGYMGRDRRKTIYIARLCHQRELSGKNSCSYLTVSWY